MLISEREEEASALGDFLRYELKRYQGKLSVY